MRHPAVLLTVIAALCPGWAHGGPTDCDGAGTDREQAACYAQAFRQEERALSETYRRLMSDLNDDYQRILFRQAQLAWKRYRDAHCDLQSYAVRNTPKYAGMRDRCLGIVTAERLIVLNAYQPEP